MSHSCPVYLALPWLDVSTFLKRCKIETFSSRACRLLKVSSSSFRYISPLCRNSEENTFPVEITKELLGILSLFPLETCFLPNFGSNSYHWREPYIALLSSVNVRNVRNPFIQSKYCSVVSNTSLRDSSSAIPNDKVNYRSSHSNGTDQLRSSIPFSQIL